MISIVEGWTNEIGHSCIEYGKLAVCTLLHIQAACDERTTLSHNGTTQFEM